MTALSCRFHGQMTVEDDPKVACMVCWIRGGFELQWPPAVVPGRGVVPEDQNFCFVSVELEVVLSHPVSYVGHSVGEVGFGVGGVLG